MLISSRVSETKSSLFAFWLRLTRLSIRLCVASAANEASKLPIAGDGIFLRRAAWAWDSEPMKILRGAL